MKKKLLAVLLTAVMTASTAACGNNTQTATQGGTEGASNSASEAGSGAASAGDVADAEDVLSTFVLDSEMVIDESRPNTSTSDERYDTFTSAITQAINDLSPFQGGPGKVLITCEIYESLFDQTGLDEYVGRIAKELNKVDDTHYEITIYDNIHDHDGNPMTASDIKFSYDEYKNSGYLQDAAYLDSVEVVDDYTVRFNFTKPLDGVSTFTNLFVNTYVFTEKSYNEHNFATDPIGTGPYYISDFVAGSHVTASVYEDYWQTGEDRSEFAAQNVQNIRVDTLGDDSLCELAVTTGNNGLQRVDSSSVNKYLPGGEYYGMANLYLNPMPVYHAILPNCSEGNFFSDINARLALFYAIDLDTLCTAAGSITFQPCKVYTHNFATDYDESWDAIGEGTYQQVYDPELAKEYLEKAGYDGRTIRILLDGDSSKVTMATVLQGFLQAIGVNSEIMSLESTVADATHDDPEAWDIYMGGESARPYVINGLMSEFGADFNNGTTTNFIYDDKFQELLSTAYTAEGYSSESTAAILQYMIDNAYGMATVSSVDVYAYSPAIAHCCKTYSGSWIFGASEYYLD